MKAMILAAGRGERLRPLTDACPKPLLPIGGKPIVEHSISALVNNGIKDIIINLSYKADLIKNALGNGQHLGAKLSYSDEGPEALETAGGILKALSFFEDQPFLVINGDIFTDYPYARLLARSINAAYLVMVPNPQHHLQGDFGLDGDLLISQAEQLLTFSGIGLYTPQLFSDLEPGRHPLGPLLRAAIKDRTVNGELYNGLWMDIGTVERYRQANEILTQ